MSSRSLLVCVLVTALVAGRVFAAEPDPLAEPPFTFDPAELLRAVQALPEPADETVEFLLHEVHVRFDERGRRTWTWRLIYRPLTAEAARGLGVVRSAWSPWYEEKPRLEARVVTADGKVFALDQKTIDEAPLDDSSPALFDDRRILQAPIPGIAAHAVVEEMVVTREVEPFFSAGVTSIVRVNQSGPVRRARIVVEAPKSLPLKWQVFGVSAAPRRKVSGDLVRLELELADVKPLPPGELEPLTPPEFRPVPTLVFSSGASWKAVGAEYGRIVQERLAGAELESIVERVVGSEKGRDEIARRLTAWLQRTVRYAGVHFGEAKMVPGTPAETLERGFGDCKDMSTLLVGLLRAAGVPAEVALVSTDEDVEPKLPGMGQFDHAIVHVPGKKPLWIDPTNEAVAFGTVPLSLQGKHALPTGAGKLVQIPAPNQHENRLKLVREYHLSEEGRSRIVETRESTGALAAWYRDGRPEDRKKSRENAEAYGKRVFGAESLGESEEPEPGDTRDPFRIRHEYLGCERAETRGVEASVGVNPGSLIALMPEFLKQAPAEGEAPKEKGWRKQGLVLPCPYVAEIEHRILPPPGFSARPVPGAQTWAWGPAVLTRSFEVAHEGPVTVRYTFTTGSGRFTAEQTEQLAAGLVKEVVQSDDLVIAFDLKAAQLLAAGRKREAFEEYERLIALHPHEARHHLQLAGALLDAGFGLAARASARKAVELEPKSVPALVELARALQHDALGRWLKLGYDRAGALEALRAARKLGPEDFRACAELAHLLEHDEHGVRYSARADLDAAIAEYRLLHPLGPVDDNLLLILDAKQGRLDELARDAADAVKTPLRHAALVAVAAVKKGLQEAEAEAARLAPDPEARRTLNEMACDLLVQLRYYPEATALLRRAAAGSPNAYAMQARAAILEKVRRYEALDLSGKEPADALKRLFVLMLSPSSTDADLKALMSTRRPLFDPGGLELVRKGAEIGMRQSVSEVMPAAVLLDITLSVLEVTLEGDEATGWRAVVRAATAPAMRQEYYLVREEGSARLHSGELQALVGEAMDRLEAGDAKAARKWLGWAKADLRPSCAEETEAQTLQRAAAKALSGVDGKPQIAPLTEALACARGSSRERIAALLARALLGAGDGAAAIALAEKELGFDEGLALRIATAGYRSAERASEGRARLEQRLQAKPDDLVAVDLLRQYAMIEGELELAERLTGKLLESGPANAASLHNDRGWIAAFKPAVGAEALENARRAVALSNERSRPLLHTLATLYAQSDRPDEAMQVIRKAIDLGSGAIDTEDWYVVGRAAESYGLLEEARRAYARVEKLPVSFALQTWELARRRLEVLDGGKAKTSAEAAPE